MASNVSFYGVFTNLNSNELNSIYLSVNVSIFIIADLMLASLFCTRYIYKSLKYGWIKYPASISFTATGRCVHFRTFLCTIFKILSKSACFGNKICTRLLIST